MKASALRLLAFAASASFAHISHATIIGGAVTGGGAFGAGGVFVKIAPGFTQSDPDNTVGEDGFDSPNLWGFDEDQNIFLSAALSVDDLLGGGAGVLGAGTEVASHYVFFDPLNNTQTGYVDFDSKILAIISSTGLLLASDFLANTGVNYENPLLRGLELGQDSATISPTLDYRLLVNWAASTPGDYVRVLTVHSVGATVPDATSTVGLLGGALVLVGVLSRRRRS